MENCLLIEFCDLNYLSMLKCDFPNHLDRYGNKEKIFNYDFILFFMKMEFIDAKDVHVSTISESYIELRLSKKYFSYFKNEIGRRKVFRLWFK